MPLLVAGVLLLGLLLVGTATQPSRVPQALRDLGALESRFRARLQAFLDDSAARGHPYVVLETYRSQLRQDALYEQGRTAPGPVVTWTRTSNHTAGGYGAARAADLWPRGLSFDERDTARARTRFEEDQDLLARHGLARPALERGDFDHVEPA